MSGISDEAIEECFPPTDEDLAELECMDEFLEMLCHLDSLEECDAFLRSNKHLGKRWEAKRTESRINPRPARSSPNTNAAHLSKQHLFKLTAGEADENIAADVQKPLPSPRRAWGPNQMTGNQQQQQKSPRRAQIGGGNKRGAIKQPRTGF